MQVHQIIVFRIAGVIRCFFLDNFTYDVFGNIFPEFPPGSNILKSRLKQRRTLCLSIVYKRARIVKSSKCRRKVENFQGSRG